MILGGPSDSDIGQSIFSAITTTGRRKTGAAGNERPRFAIRFGFRPSTNAERGGSVLAADKNLGFLKVKTEAVDDEEHLPTASRRTRNDLEVEDQDPGDGDVHIREEDESDGLRVSDFRQVEEDDDQSEVDQDEDIEYQENERAGRGGSKRKLRGAAAETAHRGKRGKAVDQENAYPASQIDQKPTLQVGYAPLKLHAQTLYIVVHTVGSSSSPFTATTAAAATTISTGSSSKASSNKRVAAQPAQQPQAEVEFEDDNLFPPGLDDFLASAE